MPTNQLGQPIGPPVENWKGAKPPSSGILNGRACRLEPLDPARHGADLHASWAADLENRIWTYLPYGPFKNIEDCRSFLADMARLEDPFFYTIIDNATERAAGVASFLRIAPDQGTIEVGHINYSPALQRTVAATEAMYLMMRYVFETLGYRRYEWKCDALNAPSRRSAERLGFTFEGVFRQATLYKGRNRDTAWYAVIDKDWPALKSAYERWLSPENFDAGGGQRYALADMRKTIS